MQRLAVEMDVKRPKIAVSAAQQPAEFRVDVQWEKHLLVQFTSNIVYTLIIPKDTATIAWASRSTVVSGSIRPEVMLVMA